MRVDIQTDFPLAQSREQMVGNVYPVRGGFGARNGAWESWADEDPTEIASVEDARSFIAQHYAPVIAENERLRQLLPFTRHNINCPVSYGTTADQCLCGLTKARATLAKLEKARG